VLAVSGAEDALEALMRKAACNESIVTAILSGELGVPASRTTGGGSASSPLLSVNLSAASRLIEGSGEQTASEEDIEPVEAAPSDILETTISGSDSYISAEGLYVKNTTSYDVDIEALLAEDFSLALPDGEPRYFYTHHGSEAYTPSGEDIYTPSDPSRTEDKDFNVVRVGDALAAAFSEAGLIVVHDRSCTTTQAIRLIFSLSHGDRGILEKYPSICVVIDLHRDALETATARCTRRWPTFRASPRRR
jgi:stage II sporulation protein P